MMPTMAMQKIWHWCNNGDLDVKATTSSLASSPFHLSACRFGCRLASSTLIDGERLMAYIAAWRKRRRAWQVEAAWRSSVGGVDDDEVAVRAFNETVSKGSMRTLKDGVWLGDEVRRRCDPTTARRFAFSLGRGRFFRESTR